MLTKGRFSGTLFGAALLLFGSFYYMNSTQNIFTTLPETLHQSLNTYLERHPDWDERRLITAAISLFLLQNADGDRSVSQVYLETLFRRG